MSRFAIVFLSSAVVAGGAGLWGLGPTAAGVAKVLFFGLLILALVTFLFGRRPFA